MDAKQVDCAGHDRSGRVVAVDGKVWPKEKPWPQEVVDGFEFCSRWPFVNWTPGRMEAACIEGELSLIVWYSEGRIVAGTTVKFTEPVGGWDLEIVAGYGTRGGPWWSKRVLPAIERLARHHGCVSLTMGSPRRIDKLIEGFTEVCRIYRKEL